MRTLSPATTARIPAASRGVQRCQPACGTRLRCRGSLTAWALPLRPTAPISDPPNQLASPRSRTVRATVLVSAMLGPFRSAWVLRHARLLPERRLDAEAARKRSAGSQLQRAHVAASAVYNRRRRVAEADSADVSWPGMDAPDPAPACREWSASNAGSAGTRTGCRGVGVLVVAAPGALPRHRQRRLLLRRRGARPRTLRSGGAGHGHLCPLPGDPRMRHLRARGWRTLRRLGRVVGAGAGGGPAGGLDHGCRWAGAGGVRRPAGVWEVDLLPALLCRHP